MGGEAPQVRVLVLVLVALGAVAASVLFGVGAFIAWLIGRVLP